MIMLKLCTKCKTEKPTSEFFNCPRTKDGLEYWCKSCKYEYQKLKGYGKDWYWANKEKKSNHHKAYYQENRDKFLTRSREYRITHVQECKEYKLTHKNQATGYTKNRRARIKNSNGKISYQEWIDLCIKYDNKCLSCGLKTKLTLDHVIPLKLGGMNIIENAQPLCRSCNSKKGIRIIDYRSVLGGE